jgi:hypothetical protein
VVVVASQVVDSVSSIRSSRFVPAPDAEAPELLDATLGVSANALVSVWPAPTVSPKRRRPWPAERTYTS